MQTFLCKPCLKKKGTSWSRPEVSSSTLAQEFPGHRILELGSGTGVAGLAAAACGAHVVPVGLNG